MTAKRVNAQIVSRQLRAEGFNVSPSARRYRYPGLFVSTSGDAASVLVDTELDGRNQRVAGQVRDVLEGKGYVVRVRTGEDGAVFLTVSR